MTVKHNLTYSDHTPHSWPRAKAVDALIEACDIWPSYSFRAYPHGRGVVIFAKNDRHQPEGWLTPRKDPAA